MELFSKAPSNSPKQDTNRAVASYFVSLGKKNKLAYIRISSLSSPKKDFPNSGTWTKGEEKSKLRWQKIYTEENTLTIVKKPTFFTGDFMSSR